MHDRRGMSSVRNFLQRLNRCVLVIPPPYPMPVKVAHAELTLAKLADLADSDQVFRFFTAFAVSSDNV